MNEESTTRGLMYVATDHAHEQNKKVIKKEMMMLGHKIHQNF